MHTKPNSYFNLLENSPTFTDSPESSNPRLLISSSNSSSSEIAKRISLFASATGKTLLRINCVSEKYTDF